MADCRADLVASKVVNGTLQYDALSGHNRYVDERNIETWFRRHAYTPPQVHNIITIFSVIIKMYL